MVKLEDVAKKAGISKTTVSRVLNNDKTITVTDETREKILAAVEELGYKPLRKKRTKPKQYHVAMIHNNEAFKSTVDRAFYFSIRNGLEHMALKKNVTIVSLPLDHLTTISTTNTTFDGAIILGNLSKDEHDFIREYIHSQHVVVIGLANPYADQYDHISFNTRQAVYKVLDYLRELGHEQIGCLGAEESSDLLNTDSRKWHFTNYMKALDLYHEDWIIFGDKGIEAGQEIAKKLLELEEIPTALFVANDPTAIGVVQALQDAGLKVPEDMSVIGFNGDYTTEYIYPPLSTLKVNTNEMGQEAIITVLERIKGYRKLAKKVEIATHIIERKSCASITK
ncbi:MULTISPECIES: LacI family DNA-binding transcriptional regulator [Virgibacillus]|uniref:LacI family DNA-binding transcriptional regulator n=1 Tax=Virgibacillus dokdonensis TaxID=302167 RepID=A0ABU7VI83_9BACI|nr:MULTISPECIES: LacI family DNA-binding transcriptional regulator [Virgibacillus]NWO12647.1 LacI family DNA-binding transcriptional regulator [Virgibacillus sp.]